MSEPREPLEGLAVGVATPPHLGRGGLSECDVSVVEPFDSLGIIAWQARCSYVNPSDSPSYTEEE